MNATRPYELVGAGQLASAIWKHGDSQSGWDYRFNIFRMKPQNGRVSQLLSPCDVHDLVKLSRVLAAVLADDGCIAASERHSLVELAAQLESITTPEPLNCDTQSSL